MNSDIAVLFPGQGAQAPGMGKALSDSFPEAREVFEIADEALGRPLSALCFGEDAEALARTENTQPAILAVSIAAYRVLAGRGLRPGWMAGHSLGQYSALVAAGSLDLADAVRLVERRGRYMQEAVPEGRGAMAAILGLDDAGVEEACRHVRNRGVGVAEPANYNAPGQLVVAGDRLAVEAVVEEAKASGARRAVLLNVSAPFHCSLMEPAAARLWRDLQTIDFRDPVVPVMCNVDAVPLRHRHAVADALRRQVTAPVRWSADVQFMADAGARRFVEAGPGKVLTGLVKRIVAGATLLNVQEPADVDAAVAALSA